MSVGIEPYLGTGLAEMLAQRGIEARQSRLRQQEAMAPALMQALAPSIELASLGDPAMLRNAMSALQASGVNLPFGGAEAGGLASMLGGAPSQAPQMAPAAPAGQLAGGLDRDLVRKFGLAGARAIEKERLLTDVAAQREQQVTEAKGVADFQKQALSGLQNARQRMASVAQLRNRLPLAELGPMTGAGAAEMVNFPKIAEVLKSGPTKQVLGQATQLYNDLRSSATGQRLFSQEVPTELKATVLNTPEQIEGLLSALEMGAQFDILVGELMQEAAAQARAEGRRLAAQDQADVINAANELILELFPNKAEIERSLSEL